MADRDEEKQELSPERAEAIAKRKQADTATIFWQLYAAGLDYEKSMPPEEGVGLDGYPLQRPKKRKGAKDDRADK